MTYSIYTRNTDASGEIDTMLSNIGLDPVVNLGRKMTINEIDSTLLGLLDVSRRSTTSSLTTTLVNTLDYGTINSVSGSFKIFVFGDVFEGITPVSMYVKVTEPLLNDSYMEVDHIFSFHIEGDDLVLTIGPLVVGGQLGNGEIEVYVVTM